MLSCDRGARGMEGAEGRTLAAHCQNDMLHTCLQHVRRWDCRDWARRWGGGESQGLCMSEGEGGGGRDGTGGEGVLGVGRRLDNVNRCKQ